MSLSTLTQVPLHTVADVIDPHPSHRAPGRVNQGIPFVGIGDLSKNTDASFPNARMVSRSIFDEHAARYDLKEGLLGLGRVASVGLVVDLPIPDLDSPYVVSPTLAIIKAKSIDKAYLKFQLMSPHVQLQLEALKQGSGRESVGVQKLRNVLIHVPPLEVQQQIVETLDDHLSRLDKALVECSDARSSLTLFERAIIHEAFSSEAVDSEMVDFKHFFNVLQPKFEGYKQKDYLAEGKLPIIDQGNALIGGYVDEMTRRIETQRPLVIFGDHTRCVKFVDFPFAIGADGTKMLEPAENVEPRFAYWQLRGTKLRNRGYARHMGELRQARFWLPQASTQKEITQKVEQAFESSNHLRAHLEAQESAVDLMRRSILHAAFSGKMKGLKSNG